MEPGEPPQEPQRGLVQERARQELVRRELVRRELVRQELVRQELVRRERALLWLVMRPKR